MDGTKRPLSIPPEFGIYAEKHGIFEMYKDMLEQLLVHKPDDPLAFLMEHLKKDTANVPQVILIGPPASGKKTISKMLSNKLRCAHVTPEGMIEESDKKTQQEVKSYQDKNQPIPTELWTRMLQNRLGLFDAQKKGWVMDGFPQTREQALAMQAKGVRPKHAVLLEAADTVLIERASGKRVDPKTGDVYHTTFDWPTDAEVASRLESCDDYSEEAVIDKLVLYHRHIDSVIGCFRGVCKSVNADQPKADVFAQVCTYISGKARSAAPHTPRVIVLGTTGSGKTVQATLMAKKYNIVRVSMGQLIKQAIADETKSGAACKPYVEKDMLVPDAIVLKILIERLCQLDCQSRGWILHGYPRTREQAEQLAGAGHAPNRVFFLDVPNDSVVERLTLRATDPITGDRYHMLYNPPRTQDVKDRLNIHPNDSEDNVRKRMSNHSAYAEELADYYEDSQRINGDQDPHTVFECIESMVVNPLPTRF